MVFNKVSFRIVFILLGIICAMGKAKNCGKVLTTEGDEVVFEDGIPLNQEEFKKVHLNKMKGALVNPMSAGNCTMRICGFTSLSPRISDNYIGSNKDIRRCNLFTETNVTVDPMPFNDVYNVSTISCSCEHLTPNCNAPCEEKINNKKWKENECALLFQGEDCNDCTFKSYTLQKDTELRTNTSVHFTSVLVRDLCVVHHNMPALRKYWDFRDSQMIRNYTRTDTVMSAYDSESETFSCTCAVRRSGVFDFYENPCTAADTVLTKEECKKFVFKIGMWATFFNVFVVMFLLYLNGKQEGKPKASDGEGGGTTS